jgi:hypothetical protein
MLKAPLLSLLAAVGLAVSAFGQTVVIPNANASVAGNDSSGPYPTTPQSFQAQEVFDPSQFPAEPIYITGFAFRAVPGTGSLNISGSGSIYLSTSRTWPNTNTGHTLLSTTFANNAGSDNTLVTSSGIAPSSPACSGPAPCPFGTVVPFTTRFLYNPANGPLLMWFMETAYSGSGQSDVQDCNGNCVALSVTGALGAAVATRLDSSEGIIQFTYTPASQTTTYRYTGNSFNRCNGVFAVNDNCPANYASDYVTASVTFLSPLGPNLSAANELNSPNLVSWTLGDAFGSLALSSTDVNAAQELTALSFSTNSVGGITGWTMDGQTPNFMESPSGGQGSAVGLVNPTFIGGGTGLPLADYFVANGGDSAPTGYNSGDSIPGTWTTPGTGTQTSPVVTYQYTGSPFSTCNGATPPPGTCPLSFSAEDPSPSYAMDYMTASLTFSSGLAPNLPLTNELTSPNLVAWTIGDALGFFSISSADSSAATELTTLMLSTDGNGNIVDYTVAAVDTRGNGAYLNDPAIIGGGTGLPLADSLQLDLGKTNSGGGYLGNSTVGQWSKPPSGTVYQISQTGIGFDHGSVTGIIQTDGTLGTLTSANILGWDLVVYDGVSNTYSLTGGSGGNSSLTISGAGLTATATQLSYNFAANGSLQIVGGTAAWGLNISSGYQTILPVGLNGNALPESGSVVLGTALAPGFFTANSFFDGQQPSSVPGWSYLQFPDGIPFGYYAFLAGSASSANSWIFHADLGYEYSLPGAATGSLFMYDLASGHWWYTASPQFPYLYDFTLNTWLYYFPNPKVSGRYSTNPRYFGNLATNTIFTM